jgi:hypothetical protein
MLSEIPVAVTIPDPGFYFGLLRPAEQANRLSCAAIPACGPGL